MSKIIPGFDRCRVQRRRWAAHPLKSPARYDRRVAYWAARTEALLAMRIAAAAAEHAEPLAAEPVEEYPHKIQTFGFVCY